MYSCFVSPRHCPPPTSLGPRSFLRRPARPEIHASHAQLPRAHIDTARHAPRGGDACYGQDCLQHCNLDSQTSSDLLVPLLRLPFALAPGRQQIPVCFGSEPPVILRVASPFCRRLPRPPSPRVPRHLLPSPPLRPQPRYQQTPFVATPNHQC